MDIYSIILVLSSLGFAAVAVQYDCESLLPVGTAPRVSSKSGSVITVNTCSPQCQYITGGNVIVTINGGSSGFTSIILQARQVKLTTPIGTFSLQGLGEVTDCKQHINSTFLYSASSPITYIKVLWKAPPDQVIGQIEFVATLMDNSGSLWHPKSVVLDQQKSPAQVALDGQREDNITAQIALQANANLNIELISIIQSKQQILNQTQMDKERKQQEDSERIGILVEQQSELEARMAAEKAEQAENSQKIAEDAKLAAAIIQELLRNSTTTTEAPKNITKSNSST